LRAPALTKDSQTDQDWKEKAKIFQGAHWVSFEPALCGHSRIAMNGLHSFAARKRSSFFDLASFRSAWRQECCTRRLYSDGPGGWLSWGILDGRPASGVTRGTDEEVAAA
jgi:hypothetical protein